MCKEGESEEDKRKTRKKGKHINAARPSRPPPLLASELAAALAVTSHHTHPPSAICHPSLLDRALHTK
jgi:hypothetical protein